MEPPRKLPVRKWHHYFKGGFWTTVGFMLSPLSWWNDAFVNLPLALAFGWVIGLAYKPAFEAGVILGYWLTNLLGFVLMHRGIQALVRPGEKPEIRRELKKDVLISLGYTLLIVVLLKLNIIPSFGMGS